MEFEFTSRRSPVYGMNGMVASSQPLATAAGLKILQSGGNAASAAIAVAAALNVTEPTSTGLGGDAFALFYSADQKRVFALNGSGRAPGNLSLKKLQSEGITRLPFYHPYTITVPGACAAWFDLNSRFGNMSFSEVLQPAIDLAQSGFPVAAITAYFWQLAAQGQLKNALNGGEMLIDGDAPKAGQIFHNKGLARTLRLIADHGKDVFYQGEIADAIVSAVNQAGGCFSKSDLAEHISTWEEPISIDFENKRIWECPPNGQGLAALLALNILKNFDLECLHPLSTQRLHYEIEAMRLAFADAFFHIADSSTNPAPLAFLLSDQYAHERAAQIRTKKRIENVEHGLPPATSDTVYFCVVDQFGNACSFINSNYMGFGTGIVPSGFGFSLQNRGHNFSLEENHPNCLAPRKRPYHTIIPAMVTDAFNGELIGPFGVMGGFMQPQGHMQVAISLFIDGLDPQQALDLPRFCIQPEQTNNFIAIEKGIPERTYKELAEMGHPLQLIEGMQRAVFGRGQIILRDQDSHVLVGGSDPRADGCVMTL